MVSLALIANYVFLISAMVSIGVAVTHREILATLRNRKLMARVLLANAILVPILGLILVRVIHLSTDTTIAVLLLAAAPGGYSAIQFTIKAKGELAFAVAVLFLLSIVGIFLTLLMMNVMLPKEALKGLPRLRLIGFVVLFLVLPLLVGFAIRHVAPPVAGVLYKPMNLISFISFVMATLLSMSIKGEATRTIGVAGVAAMLILILGSMVIGWWLGGPEKGKRFVLASTTSMRNVALCLMIAIGSFPERTVDVAVLAFFALAVPLNMLFAIYRTIKRRRQAALMPWGCY